MSDSRKLGIPFLVIFLSALTMKLIALYIPNLDQIFVKLLIVFALCLFGATLNVSRKKRHGNAYKKAIALIVGIFLLFMQLNFFSFSGVDHLFEFFGIDVFYINMLYIFCGYLFVD